MIVLSKNLVKKPNKKNQPKRHSQNGRVQINLSKMTIWSSWTWGQKKPYEGFFLPILPIKKTMISCNVVTLFVYILAMRSMFL
jgi:hypothetical protein